MVPFLKECAQILLSSGDLRETMVILPTRRSCEMLKKHLSKLAENNTIWLPEILPIRDFVFQYCPLTVLSEPLLLLKLYESYCRHQLNPEPFDKFYFWGKMMLDDFDELDKYIVDAQQLFTVIKDHKEVEAHFSMEEELKEMASHFWAGLLKNNAEANFEKDFMETWKILGLIYDDFSASLIREGLAYEGLAYRHLLQAFQNQNIKLPYSQMYWCGLNAFTASEEKMVEVLSEQLKLHLIWDIDPYFLDERKQQHEAGHFLRMYRSRFRKATHHWLDDDMLSRNKKFYFQGAPFMQGQSGAVAELAESSLENTVIVLCDEQLLLPLLSKLPDTIQANITMSRSIQQSMLLPLLEWMYKVAKRQDDIIWHEDIEQLLRHFYFNQLCGEPANDLLKDIEKHKRFYISENRISSFIDRKEIIDTFKKLEDFPSLIHRWENILKLIYNAVSEDEQAMISALKDKIHSLKHFLLPHLKELSIESCWKLVWNEIRAVSTPHQTDTSSGTDIMGFLETRLMDYQKVIIVGANEGILPASSHQRSFIPYHLRKGFGLPTLQEFDGIYAYHFFRLLKRSEETHLIYNNIPGENGAEKSRYLEQIMLELNTPENVISETNRSQTAQVFHPEKKVIQAEKTPEMLEKLYQMEFSASSLGLYLKCPFQFYLKYIAKIEEAQILEDSMDPGTFGNILHKTMELLYKHLLQKPLEKQDFNLLLNDKVRMEECLKAAFEHKEVNLKYDQLSGENLLAKDVIKKTVEILIKKDRELLQTAQYTIEGLEIEKRKILKINDKNVVVKGKIDRIDKVEDALSRNHFARILDYKTGKIDPGKSDETSGTDWINNYFDRENGYKVKEGFQGCMYFYLSEETEGMVGFYALKNLSKGIQWLYNGSILANRHADYFEHQLVDLLKEILNPNIPFIKKDNDQVYQYSPYSIFFQGE